MSIAGLKHEADELAGTASNLRRQRNDRTARSLAIIRSRIGSPLGLAVCFGAGFFTGSQFGHGDGKPHQRENGRSDEAGLASKILLAFMATAIKMALAFMTQKPGNSSFREPE